MQSILTVNPNGSTGVDKMNFNFSLPPVLGHGWHIPTLFYSEQTDPIAPLTSASMSSPTTSLPSAFQAVPKVDAAASLPSAFRAVPKADIAASLPSAFQAVPKVDIAASLPFASLVVLRADAAASLPLDSLVASENSDDRIQLPVNYEETTHLSGPAWILTPSPSESSLPPTNFTAEALPTAAALAAEQLRLAEAETAAIECAAKAQRKAKATAIELAARARRIEAAKIAATSVVLIPVTSRKAPSTKPKISSPLARLSLATRSHAQPFLTLVPAPSAFPTLAHPRPEAPEDEAKVDHREKSERDRSHSTFASHGAAAEKGYLGQALEKSASKSTFIPTSLPRVSHGGVSHGGVSHGGVRHEGVSRGKAAILATFSNDQLLCYFQLLPSDAPKTQSESKVASSIPSSIPAAIALEWVERLINAGKSAEATAFFKHFCEEFLKDPKSVFDLLDKISIWELELSATVISTTRSTLLREFCEETKRRSGSFIDLTYRHTVHLGFPTLAAIALLGAHLTPEKIGPSCPLNDHHGDSFTTELELLHQLRLIEFNQALRLLAEIVHSEMV